MKKVIKFEAKGGKLYDTVEEVLRAEAMEEIQEWLDENNNVQDEYDMDIVYYLTPERLVENFNLLSKLIQQVKDNTLHPDADGGM